MGLDLIPFVHLQRAKQFGPFIARRIIRQGAEQPFLHMHKGGFLQRFAADRRFYFSSATIRLMVPLISKPSLHLT